MQIAHLIYQPTQQVLIMFMIYHSLVDLRNARIKQHDFCRDETTGGGRVPSAKRWNNMIFFCEL